MGRTRLHKTPRRTPERRLADRENAQLIGYVSRINREVNEERKAKLLADLDARTPASDPADNGG